MPQFPGIDRSLIKEHFNLGYTEEEINDILAALAKNANNAGYSPSDPRQPRSINAQLAALLQRFRDALDNGHYDALLDVGYTQSEIRNSLFANLLPTTQLLERTESARASNE